MLNNRNNNKYQRPNNKVQQQPIGFPSPKGKRVQKQKEYTDCLQSISSLEITNCQSTAEK
jgi:hypothetical protein